METIRAKLKDTDDRTLIVLRSITNVVEYKDEAVVDIWDTGGKCTTVTISSLSCGGVDALFDAIDKVHKVKIGKPDTPFWIKNVL